MLKKTIYPPNTCANLVDGDHKTKMGFGIIEEKNVSIVT
jgi:hypothetical protein